jgi:hypothetical protein
MQAPPPKNFFFPFNCYNLAIRAVTLIEIFSTNYWDSKVQDLMVESRKRSFYFDIYPSTYLRPNIHQNGPKILGVKGLSKYLFSNYTCASSTY